MLKMLQARRDPADPDAAVAQIAETPAGQVAAPDYEIEGPAFERFQHARQQSLVASRTLYLQGRDCRPVERLFHVPPRGVRRGAF